MNIMDDLKKPSTIEDVISNDFDVFFDDALVFKAYSLKRMLQDSSKQLKFFNEYSVSKLAALNKSENVVHLDHVAYAENHLALVFKEYKMSFRSYIRDFRLPGQLTEILVKVAEGIKEVHSMNYIHRDLKPENSPKTPLEAQSE